MLLKVFGVLASTAVLFPAITLNTAAAQQADLNGKELQRIIANAHSSFEYQKLADYFHYEEQADRSKADKEMRDYAKWFSLYHGKVRGGVESTLRWYEYYSAKADYEENLATHYEGLLIECGMRPVGEVFIVSVTDLKNQLSPRQMISELLQAQAARQDSAQVCNKPRRTDKRQSIEGCGEVGMPVVLEHMRDLSRNYAR